MSAPTPNAYLCDRCSKTQPLPIMSAYIPTRWSVATIVFAGDSRSWTLCPNCTRDAQRLLETALVQAVTS